MIGEDEYEETEEELLQMLPEMESASRDIDKKVPSYRGTSLMRSIPPVGLYSSPIPRDPW